jgi:hypothetical protein
VKPHSSLLNEWLAGAAVVPKVVGLLKRASVYDLPPEQTSLRQLRQALDTYALASRASVYQAFQRYAQWLRANGHACPDFRTGEIPFPTASVAVMFAALRLPLGDFTRVTRNQLDLAYPGAYLGTPLTHGLTEDTWTQATHALLAWSINSPWLIPSEPGGGMPHPEGRLRDLLIQYRDSQRSPP